MLLVDLSNNNREPDFHALKRCGVGGVWLKASEGDFFVDATFADRRSKANAAGLRVGAYHFARPDRSTSGVADAQFFCKVVGKIGRRDLKPVLDYERTTSNGKDFEWIRSFNHEAVNTLKVGPLFYTYPGLIPELHLPRPVGWGLWIAAYGLNDGRRHPVEIPAPWKKAVAHQFTSRGELGGYGPVDVSIAPILGAVLAHPLIGRV